MEKRYQVFISSTYMDLKEERQAVSQALLQSDCFPAQMENWPAMDAVQMEAIKEIIDQSDYYVVISAGKYGSIESGSQLSYTELEYDYAEASGKPIIRLLHRSPFDSLPGSQIEATDFGRAKLRSFHDKLTSGKICSFWENPDQLMKETIVALLDIKRRKPTDGWVRASTLATVDAEMEIEKLRRRVAELELEIATNSNRSFDAALAFSSIDEVGELPVADKIPIRDICFWIMANAYDDYSKISVAAESARSIQEYFDVDEFAEIKREVVDWCFIKLEASGLITLEKREYVTENRTRIRDLILLRPETRIWIAGKAPFNDQSNFSVLIRNDQE